MSVASISPPSEGEGIIALSSGIAAATANASSIACFTRSSERITPSSVCGGICVPVPNTHGSVRVLVDCAWVVLKAWLFTFRQQRRALYPPRQSENPLRVRRLHSTST